MDLFLGFIGVIVMVILIKKLIKSHTQKVQIHQIIDSIPDESIQVLTEDVSIPVEAASCRHCEDCFSKQFRSNGGIMVEFGSNNWTKMMKQNPGSRIIRTRFEIFGHYGSGNCNCCQQHIQYLSWRSKDGKIDGYEYLCKCVCI